MTMTTILTMMVVSWQRILRRKSKISNTTPQITFNDGREGLLDLKLLYIENPTLHKSCVTNIRLMTRAEIVYIINTKVFILKCRTHCGRFHVYYVIARKMCIT